MLASTDWLARRLEDPGVVIVDARWRDDGSGRSLYERGHIPGAVYLDWSIDLVDPDGRWAFLLAPPDRFADVMSRSGIGDRTTVVAYGDEFGSGPHRLWWACRVYGHDTVAVLDGGFAKWRSEGRPVSTEESAPPPASFTPRPGPPMIASAHDVGRARDSAGVVVVDSRPPAQFRGEAVWFETGPIPADQDGIARTPRGDIRGGRVPWAVNVPATSLYRADLTMKSPSELRELFATAGVSEDGRAITYCGVGISASAALFALTYAGIDASLYDASWEEWGRDPRRPIARG
jgi:thiosulfate/3-mercaptopyruvate sulfurtransferase